MTKELPHPERVTYYTHHLDRLRHMIVTAARNPYLEKSPGERQNSITQVMKEIIPIPEFVDEFLEKQIGSDTWNITPEEASDLPPHAIERLRKSFDNRSSALWPWLLFDKNLEQLRKDFMKNYLMAAHITGTFPLEPVFESVEKQRNIDWKHRVLAAQIMFIENCITTPEIKVATAPIMSMISSALETYKKQDVPMLQSMVRRKSPKLVDDNKNPFIHYNMWNDSDNLALMCVDRGLRDTVVNHYGVFRNAKLSPVSGYHVGQTVMVTSSIAKQCLRVANEE